MVRKEPDGTLSAAIGDFGSAKLTDPHVFPIINSSTSMSLAWTPPEYFVGGIENYSNPTIYGDVWSFACTVIEVQCILRMLRNYSHHTLDNVKFRSMDRRP